MLDRYRPVIALIAVIWVVEAINQLLGHRLNPALGLAPRSTAGLVGVLTMPFLHGGVSHALANTVPLLILGVTASLVAPRRFMMATGAIVILSGLGVWLLARPGTVHVGASGLVFGWFGFVLALGVVERSVRALAGAAIVAMVYGTMIWGIVPSGDRNISWEAHLFGAVAGAFIAFRVGRRRPA